MSAQQKQAWFMLAVFAVAAAGYLALLPWAGPKAAFGVFGLCGLWGLQPFLFRKKHGSSTVTEDERTQQIQARSLLAGWALFWVCYVAACMIPWGILYYRGHETVTIDVHLLPLAVFAAMIIFCLTQAVVTLLQCGREAKHADP